MADVTSTINSWSTTAASNLPANSAAVGPNTLADNQRTIQAVVRDAVAGDGTIASATTTDLSTVNAGDISVTGTTTITGFGTLTAGIKKVLTFSGALTLTRNASSLILPGAANITTAAGDVAIMRSLGSGNWRCLSFTRAASLPVAAGAVTSSGLTMTTARLLGRTTASTGAVGEITVGSGLTLSAGTISSSSGITLGTPVATTSGTAIDFTGIPSGTKRIIISFVGVSANANSNWIIQIGDSGGIETTGYLGSGSTWNNAATPTVTNFTTGFGIITASAANVWHGSVILTLENSSTNTWVASGNLSLSNTTSFGATSGSKSTSAVLDRVRLTTVSTDTFDAGEINIQYE